MKQQKQQRTCKDRQYQRFPHGFFLLMPVGFGQLPKRRTPSCEAVINRSVTQKVRTLLKSWRPSGRNPGRLQAEIR
jgi:hypothetical protein